MSFLERLDEDLKKALKGSDKLRLSVLRMAKAAIKNQQIDKGRILSDEEVISILTTMSKQRKESIEQFSKGGRTDLAEQETQELSILQSYMPEQLSNEEVENIIVQAINESAAKSEADMGKVMKILMPRVKGVADGKWVNNRVRELLKPSGE
ncbi:MAG: aspartyl-tRNA amidotransferase [Nitrospirae bacterium GWC2_42_7]|nr:MAG: aspartyl-tRNA amidotransferase [Nitrospirae bacterium GWC2_42_7]